MYKILAIDMDDTLLNDKLIITKENIEAIKKATEKGVKVVICSGRSNEALVDYIEQFDGQGCNEYFISYNGAVIKDIVKDEVIYYKSVTKEITEELIDYGRRYNISVNIYIGEDLFVEKYDEYTKVYEQTSNLVAKVIPDLKEKTKNGSIKVLFNYTHEGLLPLKEELENKYKDKIDIYFSKPYYLECTNSNKGVAVLKLAEHLGVKREEVIAIGDSFNDKHMIEMVGLGCAMINGNPEVKKVAKYITENDNNNNGVAEVINKFIL